MTYAIGIDIGGTFTDFLAVDEQSGRQIAHKSSSTPHDPSEGLLNGLTEIAELLDLELRAFLSQVRLIVHGTTVATNAVLTERGARTGLITTTGVRDILEMRRGVRSREHLYDNKHVAPQPLVPRALRLGVDERTDIDGNVLTVISESDARAAVRQLLDAGVESIAICFMHSYADAGNEQRVLAVAREMAGERFVSASHDVLPQIRLYQRISTTVMNAYVGPVVQRYIHRLTERLETERFGGTLLIMQSNGGVAAPDVIERLPASTVLSGPAGGPVAALHAAANRDEQDCILVEMGGTSFDASLVKDGQVQVTRNGEIHGQSLSLPMTEIHTIGAGGGSIAWVDSGGLLQVGPQSAGAAPGPAAYGRGGEHPTVTDANLVLGYVDPQYFLGGRMELRKDLSERAIQEHVAGPLGISVAEAAAGIIEVVTLKMAAGTKDISVSRGYDPREFPLVVGGGAGPLHAAAIARELDMRSIIVPRRSAVLCASGMLQADLRHDFSRSFARPWRPAEGPAAAAIVDELIAEGREVLRGEGIGDDEQAESVSLDLRYAGQHHEITVDVARDALTGGGAPDVVAEAFHAQHRQLFGHCREQAEIEVLTVRATVRGTRPSVLANDADPIPTEPGQARKAPRRAWLDHGKRWADVDVFDGVRLAANERVDGPAIVETATTTIWVAEDFDLLTDPSGDFILHPKTTKAGER